MKSVPKKDKMAKLISLGIQHDKVKSDSLPSFGKNSKRFNEDIGFSIPQKSNYKRKNPYMERNLFPINLQ